MSTDALNPAVPTGSNQVELSSELRGIKTRLVADKAAIEAVQTALLPLNTAGAMGLQILADSTADAVFDDLAITALGQGLVQDYTDLPSLKSYLGIIGAATEIITTAANSGSILFPGGFILKYEKITIPSGGGSYAGTWNQAFPTICLAGWIVKIDSGDQASWLTAAPTVTGYNADHNNGSAKAHIVFGIGL